MVGAANKEVSSRPQHSDVAHAEARSVLRGQVRGTPAEATAIGHVAARCCDLSYCFHKEIPT